MRYISALLWAASTGFAFPTNGIHSRNISTPFYGNSSTYIPSSSTAGSTLVTVKPAVDTPPTTTLIPTVHWSVDISDTVHLVPGPSSQVYYAEDGINDPTQQHQMGSMNINYVAPAVMLDHSDSLTVTYDPTQGLIITFSSQDSFNVASSTWSPENGLLMVTYLEGCGDYDDMDFCYFQVTAVTCTSGIVCVASGSPISHVEAFVSADVEWGTYYPSTPPSFYGGGDDNGNTTTDSGTTTDSDEYAAPPCGLADPKYGLPTAPLGVDFDLSLDDCFGYETLNDTDYAAYVDSIANGAVLEDDPDNVADTSGDLEGDEYLLNKTLLGLTPRSNSLQKRIPFITEPVTKDLFKKEYTFQLPKQKKIEDTPFGQGVLLKAFGTKQTPKSKASADLSIYCVECGAKGAIDLSGKASFAVTKGVTAAELVAIADLQIAFQIGVVANAQYEQKFDFKIAEVGLPGLSFGVVTIGPQISIGTDASFNARASGQLLAGAKFGFQNAKSVINFKDQSKSESSGWTPTFEPVLKASGSIVLSAELGFPVGLDCALTIKGVGKLGAGIVERPAIEAKAEFSASLEGKNASITTTDGCQGIATQITFKNFLYVALDAFNQKKQIDLIKPFTKVLNKGCIKLSKGSSKPTRRQISNTTLVDVTTEIDQLDSNYTSIVLPYLPSADFNTTDGIDYIGLTDTTSSVIVTSCSDGNMYFQLSGDNSTLADYSCSTLFQSVDSNIIADGLGRLMHYYNNTMSTLGVSRLRVSDEETIPIGASYLSLNPSDNNSSTSDTFSAVDPSGKEFFPVVCTYTNVTYPPRLFVVNNTETGLDILQSSDLEFIVTGGPVDGCYYLPIMAELDGGQDFDDAYNVNESDEGGDAEFDSDV